MPKVTADQKEKLLNTLEDRFLAHMHRHKKIKWDDVLARIEKHPAKVQTLFRMEETGGEPDVIGVDKKTGAIIFCDCSAQSPKGRRSLCYDQKALESRKNHKPEGSAISMAKDLGVSLLTEEEYRELQALEPFDTKTSSWLQTPKDIRKLGGAIFGDCRYETVFIYHNGAESYYAARGFRGLVTI